MIRRTSKYLVVSALISFAAYANAGTAAVTPALAACSKALIETHRQGGNAAGVHGQVAEHVRLGPGRPELLHGARAQREDEGTAGQGLVQGHAGRRDRLVQVDSAEELKTLRS